MVEETSAGSKKVNSDAVNPVDGKPPPRDVRWTKTEFGVPIVIAPVVVHPDQTVGDVSKLRTVHGIGTFPVIERGTYRLIGIITSRDIRYVRDPSMRVYEIMTRENLVTATNDVTREGVQRLLHRHRLQKVMVIDGDYRLIGLIHAKDMDATEDSLSRLDTVELEPPVLPAQGIGPHFEPDENGIIDFAPPEVLDRNGNNIRRLRDLHPTLVDLALALVEALSQGNAPHANLLVRAEAYHRLISKNLGTIDFSRLYVEGVRLTNADRAANHKIIEGELPTLTEYAQETLDTLLQLHGVFIMATVEGVEAITEEERYRRRPEEERQYREAATEMVACMELRPDIIRPEVVSVVRDLVSDIGQGPNPERSSVVATGILRNLTIALAAGSIGAALTVIGGLTLGPAGVAIGSAGAVLVIEGLKKSTPFGVISQAITKGIDRVSQKNTNENLRASPRNLFKYIGFLLDNEDRLRRFAGNKEDSSWLHKTLDWLKRHVPDNDKR